MTETDQLPRAAYSIHPTSQDAWRLVGHYLHHRCHTALDGPQVDQRASVLREELRSMPLQRGQDVTVAMWLPLAASMAVECADPGCPARRAYLASDGSGYQPAYGPLPGFVRDGALAYFTYTAHPHGEAWASSVDPEIVDWMTTALALCGGFLRVDFFDFQDDDGLTMGHTLWSVADQQLTVLSRHEVVAGDGGVSETHPPSRTTASVYPPLPPEIQAEQERSHREAGP